MNSPHTAISEINSPNSPQSAVDLVLLKQEVDALQVALHAEKIPWYKNISTLISVIALIFSFGTTFVSYVRTNNQDIQSSRVELRSILQRLSALPKENVEMMKTYESDQAALTEISGFLNQENSLLSRQAAEITKKIPTNYISATEYCAIANALAYSYNYDSAKEFFTKAIEISDDINDRVGALRNRANLLFITGQPEAGRVDYQRALNVFTEIKTYYNDYTQKSTHIQTELSWAFSEAGVGAKDNAFQHIRNAENYVSNLMPGPGTVQQKKRLEQAIASISGNQPLPNKGEIISTPLEPSR